MPPTHSAKEIPIATAEKRGFRPWNAVVEGLRNRRRRRTAEDLLTYSFGNGNRSESIPAYLFENGGRPESMPAMPTYSFGNGSRSARRAVSEALSIFDGLGQRQQIKLMRRMETALTSCSSFTFETVRKTATAATIADFFTEAAKRLPKDGDGHIDSHRWKKAISRLESIANQNGITPEEAGDSNGHRAAAARLSCAKALWELEDNSGNFWEERLSDPATRRFTIQKMLELQDEGWPFLKRCMNDYGMDIIRTHSPKKIAFIMHVLSGEDAVLARKTLELLAYLEPMPEKLASHIRSLPVDAGARTALFAVIDAKKQLGTPGGWHGGTSQLIDLYRNGNHHLAPLLSNVGAVITGIFQNPEGEDEISKARVRGGALDLLLRLSALDIEIRGVDRKEFLMSALARPDTRALAIARLLELPPVPTNGWCGWSFLAEHLAELSMSIARHQSPARIQFFLSFISEDGMPKTTYTSDESVREARLVLDTAAYLDVIPKDVLAMAAGIATSDEATCHTLCQPARALLAIAKAREKMRAQQTMAEGVLELFDIYGQGNGHLIPMLVQVGSEMHALNAHAQELDIRAQARTVLAAFTGNKELTEALLAHPSTSTPTIGMFLDTPERWGVLKEHLWEAQTAIAASPSRNKVAFIVKMLEDSDLKTTNSAMAAGACLINGRGAASALEHDAASLRARLAISLAMGTTNQRFAENASQLLALELIASGAKVEPAAENRMVKVLQEMLDYGDERQFSAAKLLTALCQRDRPALRPVVEATALVMKELVLELTAPDTQEESEAAEKTRLPEIEDVVLAGLPPEVIFDGSTKKAKEEEARKAKEAAMQQAQKALGVIFNMVNHLHIRFDGLVVEYEADGTTVSKVSILRDAA